MAGLAGLPTCRPDHGSDWPLGITTPVRPLPTASVLALHPSTYQQSCQAGSHILEFCDAAKQKGYSKREEKSARRRPKPQNEKELVEELVQKNKAWEERYDDMQKEAEGWRRELKSARKKVSEITDWGNKLEQNLEAAMEGRLVPIVAAVVLKAVYKKVTKVSQQSNSADNLNDRAQKIRDLRCKFVQFGCENEAQVVELADAWSGIIDARNTAAHQVTGDDVLEVLPYCGDQLHHILERAFRSLWGISPGDWPKATPAQKALMFRNYCELESGPVEDYLKTVVEWLRDNPFEVVTILIGNGGLLDVGEYLDPLEKSGLAELAYVPKQRNIKINQWPALSEKILTGKRAVVFVDYKADEGIIPYLLDEFKYMWETPFSQTDETFPCTIDRPPEQPKNDTQGKLYMANHNLNAEFSIAGSVPKRPVRPSFA